LQKQQGNQAQPGYKEVYVSEKGIACAVPFSVLLSDWMQNEESEVIAWKSM
jgi:hypothetical protein